MQTAFTPAQLADPEVAASEQILRKCVHCGFCTATCPTYVLLGDELDSPRGRIYLIKEMLENSRPASEAVVRHIDRCLSCLGCMTTCPSGVHYQHLIDHARVHVERTYRRPWRERVLRSMLARILPYPGRLRAAIGLARWARPIAKLLPSGAPARGTGVTASMRAMLELAAFSPVRARLGGKRSQAGPQTDAGFARTSGRVALIAGCAQCVLTPEAQAASVRLLRRAGFEVARIDGCCGALVHHLGRAGHNRAFARRLIEQIDTERRRGELDALIVTASGCGTHLKDYGYLFRNDAELAAAAARVSELTRDITEWLDAIGWGPSAPAATGHQNGPSAADSSQPSAPAHLAVAYHSACSMQHGQKLDRAPQRLLERAGFDVREIPEGHLCCGSAGSYNILQPRIAAQLRDRKLENIRRTSARVVAAGNVGCIVQLASAPDLAIVHTAELLDWAQGGPAPIALRGRSGSFPPSR